MKQLINKFLGVLLFVLVLVVMGQARKVDAATYQFISGYLTVNLDKAVYDPGELIKVAASVQTSNCGNHSNSDISLAVMQVISQDNSYAGTSQKVIDHKVTGSAAANDSFYTSANFIAPPYGGKFLMNTDFTFSYYSGGIFKTRKTVKYIFQNPFTVGGCATPAGYTKCSNENETCSFPGNANVAYGCSPTLSYKDASSSIFCSNDSFGGDPLPGLPKSCFYKTIASAPTVKIIVDKLTIYSGEKVNVSWVSENATHCNCTYGSDATSCGSGIGTTDVAASGNPYTLAESKTFTVTCDDNVTSSTNPSSLYFKLKHCTGPNEFETGPFASGTYSTGDVLAGALDNGQYDYRVVDSSENSFGLRNIGTTRTPGNACRY